MIHARALTHVVAFAALLLSATGSARAGCGCDKPPPPVAAIRPPFASPADSVTLLADGITAGQEYAVHFQAWDAGGDGPTATVTGIAVVKRDFADGVAKPQLVVGVPPLPPGPAAVSVTPLDSATAVLDVPSSDFTILQPALPLQEATGQTRATCYRAAVGADGTVYFPLDIAAIADRMIFAGRIGGYRLTFSSDDIVILNTQGVTMQLLDPDEGGLYTVDDAPDLEDALDGRSSGSDGDEWNPHKRSFRLTYDRHEFRSYRLRHATDARLAHDPTDPEWHVDGSRHFDHDHVVIAIHARVDRATAPAPGVTPPFTFRVKTILGSAPDGPHTTTLLQWSAECGTGPARHPRTTALVPPACSSSPAAGCRRPVVTGSARLDVRNAEKDRNDAIAWGWKSGQDTAPGSFGDPRVADGLAFCLYDESGDAPTLLLDTGVAPGAACAHGRNSCWDRRGLPPGSRGFAYRKPNARPDGIDRLSLSPGRSGRASIVLQGRGPLLDLPALPLPLPLRAQLQSATGQCWETTFRPSGVVKNTTERFLGKAN